MPLNRGIAGFTGLCCVIGDPIEHTLSPAMHNAAFRELGLNYIYLAFQVERKDLEEAVKGLKALGVKGINVTIPHKVEVIKHLDGLDATAEEVESVNTIVIDDEEMIGYNTDIFGVISALQGANISPRDRKVVILGAGGASRAVIAALARMGCQRLSILNRTPSKAEALARRAAELYGIECRGGRLSFEELSLELRGANLVVNTTPLGMYPSTKETPIPLQLLSRDIIVFDLVYNPLETRLLREARMVGAKALNGVEMLLGQGATSFNLWFHREPPIEAMRKALMEGLRGG